MINKLASILLQSIQQKQPKQVINKLARIILANDYQQKVIQRFIEMLGHVPENKLMDIITNKNRKYDVGSAEEPLTPQKEKRLKEELEKYNVIVLSKIADRIIEPSQKLKNKLAMKYKSEAKQDVFWVKTPKGESYKFIFKPTFHFAHRIFLRDIEDIEVKKTLWEYAIALVSDYDEATQYGSSDEGKITYYSSVKKAGSYTLKIVTGELDITGNTVKIDMISMYPVGSENEPQTLEVEDGYIISYTEPVDIIPSPRDQQPIQHIEQKPIIEQKQPEIIIQRPYKKIAPVYTTDTTTAPQVKTQEPAKPQPTDFVVQKPKPKVQVQVQKYIVPSEIKPTIPQLDLTLIESLLSKEAKNLEEELNLFSLTRSAIANKKKENKETRNLVELETNPEQKAINLKELDRQFGKIDNLDFSLDKKIKATAPKYGVFIPNIGVYEFQYLEEEVRQILHKLQIKLRIQKGEKFPKHYY